MNLERCLEFQLEGLRLLPDATVTHRRGAPTSPISAPTNELIQELLELTSP